MALLMLLTLEAARACTCPQSRPPSALEIRERRNASVRSATDLVAGVLESWTVTNECVEEGLGCLLRPGPYRVTVKLAVSADGKPMVREVAWVVHPQTCDCSGGSYHVPWAEGEQTLFWQLRSGAWDWHPIGTDPACVALASHPRRSTAVRCLDGAPGPTSKW